MHLNTPFTRNTDWNWKKLPQNSNTAVMLIWCLKQVKDLSLNFQWTVFFTSFGAVDEVLVRLLLIEKLIEDAYSMCILFSVKHPQTFHKLSVKFLQYMQNYFQYVCIPIQPQLVIKHMLKVIIRNQKIRETFILGRLFLNRWGYLDCFSIAVLAYLQNINFLIFSSLCMLMPICYNF